MNPDKPIHDILASLTDDVIFDNRDHIKAWLERRHEYALYFLEHTVNSIRRKRAINNSPNKADLYLQRLDLMNRMEAEHLKLKTLDLEIALQLFSESPS